MQIRGKILLTGTLVVIALGWTGINARLAFVRARRAPTEPWRMVDWRQYQLSGHRIGAPEPRTTVVVFWDYRCAACRVLYERLTAVRGARQQLGVVLRHYPLSQPGFTAALGAECASVQGWFPEYHRRLLLGSGIMSESTLVHYAAAAGLADTASFSRCLADSLMAGVVNAEIEVGRHLGVLGTPTFLVGNEAYVGVPWDLERIIRRHMDTVTQPM